MPQLLMSDMAAGAQAMQDLLNASTLEQQKIASGAETVKGQQLNNQMRAMEIQKEQSYLKALQDWNNQQNTPVEVGGNSASDIKASISENIGYQQKLASFMEKFDPKAAAQIRHDISIDQERLASIADKEQKEKEDKLDTSLGLLELATTPEGLARAKLALQSIPGFDPNIIENIRTPQDAQKVRMALMKTKDRLAVEAKARELARQEANDKERYRHDLAMEAKHDRTDTKADERAQKNYISGIRARISTSQANLNSIETSIRDIASDVGGLKGEEKKAELASLRSQRAEIQADIDADRQELREATEQPGKTPATKPPVDIPQRFKDDPQMKNYTLGKQTPQGYEVLDKSGKLIGHYK